MAITLKFGGYQGDNSVHTRGVHAFCDALERHSSCKVKVEFQQNISASGRQALDLLSLTESGALDACYFSSSYLAKRVPDLGLFDQHFVAPDRHQTYAMLDGVFGKRLAEKVEAETGFKVLGYWDNGVRHVTSAKGPIRSPNDCRGMKIRTLANEDHQRVFRSLGFDPVAIDVSDLAGAVEGMRVDAQENPLTNTYNLGLHKTHRHVVLTKHLLGVALVLFNKASFDSWPKSVQVAVRAAVQKATMKQRYLAEAEDISCAKDMREQGVEFTNLSPMERAMFVAVSSEQVARMRENFDAGLLELFDQELTKAAIGHRHQNEQRSGKSE
jgi:TRAP-type C4-dicarboxylate transport system substrate-binding protein